MRNITLIVAAFAVVVILTGCGHNAIQYGDGVGFDVGINPENCMLAMNLRYGKILSAVTRDNVELELTGQAVADGTAYVATFTAPDGDSFTINKDDTLNIAVIFIE